MVRVGNLKSGAGSSASFRLFCINTALLFCLFTLGYAEDPVVESSEEAQPAVRISKNHPIFLADLANPNDFSLFANGGWDGTWYVGFNTCWMQKVTVPKGKFRRAFIGAKIGRMKNYQPTGKAPWEKRAHPGKIYMAISSTPSWKRSQSFYLASTRDIPLEPDNENAVEGVGESQWFWAEIPRKMFRRPGDYYLALWSPTEKLDSTANAPILAAGWGTKEVNSWVSHDIRGMPPRKASKALSTPVTVFEPAIAMKLIPYDSGSGGAPKVSLTGIQDGKPIGKRPAPKIVCASVFGHSVLRAWVEISRDGKKWGRYGGFVWGAPYCFTLKMGDFPIGKGGKTWLRIHAADSFEEVGMSEEVNIFESNQGG